MLLLACGGRARIDMALNGKFASGFISGLVLLSPGSSPLAGSAREFEIDALFERGSTADNSTAEGVALIGKAVAVGLEGTAF